VSQLSKLNSSLENSQHKIVTEYEDETGKYQLLAVQVTKRNLDLIIDALKKLRTYHRDEKAMDIIHEAAMLLIQRLDKKE